MGRILGLDLGTNSIGWALIEEDKAIKDIGVRIFHEGVENLGEGQNEMSKNASRTAARGIRRQIFRRKIRKMLLIKALAKNKMCPLNEAEIKIWYKTGVFPDTEPIRNWLKENPYLLRSQALDAAISMMQLGRILYQIAQHRGFQSNSRSAVKEEDKEKSIIFTGDAALGKIGISETHQLIADATLGKYLAGIYPAQDKSYVAGLPRIRNRYTTRQMYIEEFELVWDRQKQYHTELTVELKELLGGRKRDGYNKDGILFFQRPLRTQKHLVGKCTFEPTKTKCPASAISFELFRAHQFVNSVECNGEKLNKIERDVALELILTWTKKTTAKFEALAKKLKRKGSNFNYKEDDTLPTSWTISQLSSKRFFDAAWCEFPEKKQEDIWHVLFSFDDRDKLKQYALEKWGFDEAKAEDISKFNLKDGYASLSKKAIKNILPFLKLGFTFDVAVVLGGIKNAFGPEWDLLPDEKRELIITNVPDIIKTKRQGGFIESIKEFLTSEFGLNNESLEKLYHHSASINKEEITSKLPVSPDADRQIANLRNPIVSTALFELRKLINDIITQHGSPDEIKIELARDLKVSKTKRNEIRREQKRLERQNEEIVLRLREYNQVISHDNILKYKLWEECQHTCPYTGKSICIAKSGGCDGALDLFSGSVQIEHIFPWSRSLDDSYINKTLCDADFNREKGDLTPYEYYIKQGKDKWEEAKMRVLKLFYTTKEFPDRYKKFQRFASEEFEDSFISRQLNDTRYISRKAKSYLEKVCNKVSVAPGQLTANLRSKWGLNTILNKEDDSKTRDDHRHHAVDALIMACFKPSHLQEISKWNRYNRKYDLKEFPMPWENFRNDSIRAIDSILISFKQRNRIITRRSNKIKKEGITHINDGIAARGQLHLENVYGLRKNKQGQEAYHIRKSLQALTPAMISKIVDAKIRELVYKRLRERGLEIDVKNGKPIADSKEQKERFATAFDKPIFLPNRNGDPVPIHKVRVKENIGHAEPLKAHVNQHVNPKNNYASLIYKKEDGNINDEVITFWIAVERKLQKSPIFKLPQDGIEIIATIKINDLFILNLSSEDFEKNKLNYSFLSKHLYRVSSISSKYYEFRRHLESTNYNKEPPFYYAIRNFGDGKSGWLTFNPIKVKISPSGKIGKIT